ncbi:MAG: CpaF family protein [Planctomycetota bacterium]|jgi:pilus assembly protein CpaF
MSQQTSIFETTVQHFLGPVLPFLNDPEVAEVMVNRWDEIYIERQGQLVKTDARFADNEAFLSAVNNVLQYTGKRVDPMNPLIDARLPDGSRVHVVLSPLSRFGTLMSIRKFAKVMFDAKHLIELGSWTPESMEYLQCAVLAEKNLLVSGGTSSGKTSLLNVLSSFIPDHQRIVVIEDSSELALQQSHVVSLESRPPDRWNRGEITISDLFKSSLRLRPDRIIIGETRGGEALDIIQAMTSGHAGSMSTLHATMPTDALNRLETLAMMNPVEMPLYALRAQIVSAIDVVVQVSRFNDGRRGLTQISEVLPLSADGKYQVHDIFTLAVDDSGRGRLEPAGSRSIYASEPKVKALKGFWRLTKEIFSEEPGA